VKDSIHAFLRIKYLECSRLRCHALVKPRKFCVFIILNALCIALIRIAVFVFGLIAKSNLLLSPMPQNTACTLILISTTRLPRFSWPIYWSEGVRGAGLVVWVSSFGSFDEQ